MPDVQEIHHYDKGRGLGEGALATATGVAGGVLGYMVGRGVNILPRSDAGYPVGPAGAIAGGAGLAVLAEKDARIGSLEAELKAAESGKALYAQTLADKNALRDEFYAYVRPLAQEAAQNRERVAVLEAQQRNDAEKAELRQQLTQKEIELAKQQAQCCCEKTNMRVDCLAEKVDGITKTVVPTVAVCPDPAAAAQERRTDALIALIVKAVEKYLNGTTTSTTTTTP